MVAEEDIMAEVVVETIVNNVSTLMGRPETPPFPLRTLHSCSFEHIDTSNKK